MRKAVCVIIENSEGKILAVSRKDNHNIFGLIGGKVDDTDVSLDEAIIRETKEETGIELKEVKLIDTREYGTCEEDTFLQHCFVALSYEGEVYSREYLDSIGEYGVVKWVEKKVVADPITGFFHEYNQWMLDIAYGN
jgi:ADP-ribose pyrophosphatase YjhB (NUDIX family)